MRAWLLIICCSLLCLTGCQTWQPAGSAASCTNGTTLSSQEQALAESLAHYGQGLLYQGSEGPASTNALAEFQKVAKANSADHDLLSKIAVIALRGNMPEIAIQALEQSYDYAPKSYERCVDLAAVYQATEKNALAVIQYQKALKLDRTPTTVYIALAGLHFHANADDQALSVLDRGKQDSETPEALSIYTFEQAKIFVTHGAISRSIPCFEKLAKWDINRRAEFYQLISELHFSQGNREAAINVLTRATKLQFPLPASFVDLAYLRLNEDNQDEAIKVLNEARDKLSDEPNILFALGCVYSDSEDFKKAIELFENVRQLNAENRSDDSTKPKALTEIFYLSLGAAYERSGHIEEAKRVFEECIQHYPDSHRVLNYLAYMLAVANRDLDQAILYINSALVIEENAPAYLDTRGWIYFQQGKFAEALKEIKKAQTLMKTPDAEILQHLGDIHEALHNPDQALECWSKSYALDSKNETVAEKLRARGIDLDALKRIEPPDTDRP